MRIVLIGAVGSTQIVLQAMQDAGIPPVLLATLAPELGRRRHADYIDLAPWASPATEVMHIESSNDPQFVARLRDIAPDMIFVIGWSQIVGAEVRAAAGRYCIGFHPTLLPALRGRAVMGWTILLGLTESGATLFEIGDEVDDGAILAQARFPLDDRETIASLGEKVTAALAEMIRDLLPRLADGSARALLQQETGISYCARRVASDSLIDWTAGRDAIDRLIRASSPPYTGAFTFTRKRKVTIFTAEPIVLPYPYHAAAGQVVEYVEGDPVVRCGDGAYLRLTDYRADGDRLAGQIRLRDRMDEGVE